MKIIFSFLVSIFVITNSFSQDSLLVNKKYLEDQIYVGITYNILTNKPQNFQQKGISTGLHIGFIKDIPLNEKGTFALAVGFGYSYNKYIQNMKIQHQIPEFSILSEEYSKNKFEIHSLEIPFEFRIRNSSATVYKFWRLYVGGKVSYIVASKSLYKNTIGALNENVKLASIPSLKKLQFGPQITFGYSTWNFYTYFNLKSLFDQNTETAALAIDQMNTLNIGLQFYMF